jgi:ABC-type bacteriocin/lantibiotic exporter with double-glycine peptidase domain
MDLENGGPISFENITSKISTQQMNMLQNLSLCFMKHRRVATHG